MRRRTFSASIRSASAALLLSVGLVQITPTTGHAQAQETPLALNAGLAILGGAAWWGSSHLAENNGPRRCNWCEPPRVDSWARNSFKWNDTETAHRMSDASAYVVQPLGMLGLVALPRLRAGDSRLAAEDSLLILQASFLSQILTQGVKAATARERPWFNALSPEEKRTIEAGDTSNDRFLSFYSGHTSYTFALASASGMVASMRGYEGAGVIWATGIGIATLTGYLRIAADRHHLTDVLAGAAAGTLLGAGIPYLLQKPARAGPAGSQVQLMAQPSQLVVQWGW